MYGYQDSTAVTPGTNGGKLGLNKGVITKFEYNANAGRDGAQQDAIDLTIHVGEKAYMKRFFPISKVFAKGGGEIADTNSQEYKDAFAKEVKLFNAETSSIVEALVNPEDVKLALSAPISTFKDFAQILERLVKSNPNWNKTQVDVFLQYQWKPTGENTRTFLELPKNVKQGIYVSKAQPGVFTEDRTETHLKYVNVEGDIHPFKRGQWFVESAFANPTILDENSSADMGSTPTSAQAW